MKRLLYILLLFALPAQAQDIDAIRGHLSDIEGMLARMAPANPPPIPTVDTYPLVELQTWPDSTGWATYSDGLDSLAVVYDTTGAISRWQAKLRSYVYTDPGYGDTLLTSRLTYEDYLKYGKHLTNDLHSFDATLRAIKAKSFPDSTATEPTDTTVTQDTTMALPSSGYATATVTNPGSALTDFTLMVDLSRMPADWWSAVDTADGTKGRAAKDDGTELATDWIDFDNVAQTGWLRVKWTGTLASTGTQVLRIYPPQAANTSYAAGDTFGSDNAYDSNWAGYWPNASPTDRTSNGADLTEVGTPGTATGQVGTAWDFDGTGSQYLERNAATVVQPLTFMAWLKPTDTTNAQCLMNVAESSTTNNRDIMYYRADQNGVIQAFSEGASTGNILGSTAGVTTSRWAHAATTFDNPTRAAFLDGGNKASRDESGVTSNIDRFRIALRAQSSGGSPYDGLISDPQAHSAVRPDAWIAEEYAQTNDQATFWGTWSWSAPGGGAFTLTADQASFSLSGQTTNLLAGRNLAAAQGAFTLAGQDAALMRGFGLTAAQGSFALSGQDAAPFAGRLLTAGQGTYSLSGQVASLLAARLISGELGAFTLSGQDATLTYTPAGAFVLAAEAGTFTLSEQQAELLAARIITADQGSFTLTGQAATLLHGFTLQAEQGSFTLTGQDAELLLTRLLTADQGAFTLNGQNAALTAVTGDVLATLEVSLEDTLTITATLSDALTLTATLED